MYVIYLSGPISNGGTEGLEGIKKNINKARELALELSAVPDVYVLTPHLNAPWLSAENPIKELQLIYDTEDMEEIHKKVLDLDLGLLERVDIMFLMHGWENSSGCQLEIKKAKELGIPIAESIDELKIIFSCCALCSGCGRFRTAEHVRNHRVSYATFNYT